MQKENREYPDLKLSVQEVKLDCGLKLVLIPRPNFNEKQVMISTNFGSTVSSIQTANSQIDYPFGVAHFLEHKIFEMGDGKDALEDFTALGAEANAFTTYQQTVYYFSTVNDIDKGVKQLITLVREWHMTQESVDEERPIIQNEILMYEDDSDYQMNRALLANLYPHTPLSEDIAGNNQTIEQISLANLTSAHDYFYQLNHLTMVAVGNFDVDRVVNEVDNFVKEDATRAEVSVLPLQMGSVVKSSRFSMDVMQPKLGLGFRVVDDLEGVSFSYYKLGLRLFLSMLLGWTSETYQNWYDNGLIDYSFDFQLEVTSQFKFVTITFDTDQPIAMTGKVKKLFKNFANNTDFSEEHLTLLKKEMYGDFIESLDSIDQLANQVTLALADGRDYLETGELIRHISLADVQKIADHFVSNMEATTVTIFPK
ncbi:EF-P 5-aminopentanol modification-associated protein YfmH [Streptococcus thoraltensis]|uniref:EF-P 5-aminopentanol modification-associated protein YfmH n=1 Tax=Streptococcus thoraltensis TaxID=55085 RepID=UPI001F5AFC29|nr:pitrilysin family protein [Streptococcus thoraltensis]